MKIMLYLCINKTTYNMKELKLKWLWAVDINGIQWTSFRLKRDANKYAKENNGVVVRKQLITDKY